MEMQVKWLRYSPEWKDHIMTWRPSFFLLADDSLEGEEEEDEDDANKKSSFQALMLRRRADVKGKLLS